MIYFRCDASSKIGFGNLKRCLILAGSLKDRAKIGFIISTKNDHVIDLINYYGFTIYHVPENISYSAEIQFYPENARNIIIDLGHPKNLQQPQPFLDYLQALKSKDYNIMMLDGLGDDSFHHKDMPEIMTVIQPYWGTDDEKQPKSQYWIHGKDYVLLDKAYQNAFVEKNNANIENILITFGGADPQENTVRVLDELKSLPNSIKIRVIVGNFFSDAHVKKIQETKKTYAHDIELIQNPHDMISHYQWADLGISGSGSSRYEAVACGLPVLFAAIYPEHIKLSQNFIKYGTADYLGYYEDISPDDWCNAVINLQKNSELYINMLDKIKEIQSVIGNGTENIANEIIRTLK